jgi:hypothetical protein
METREIGLVHMFAHEVFHFLHRSRQIPGRNGENEADQFAVAIEDEFRGAPPTTKSPINVWQ